MPAAYRGALSLLILQLCDARIWQRVPEPQKEKTGKLSVLRALKEEEKTRKQTKTKKQAENIKAGLAPTLEEAGTGGSFESEVIQGRTLLG